MVALAPPARRAKPEPRPRGRRLAATLLAGALVWFALVAPHSPTGSPPVRSCASRSRPSSWPALPCTGRSPPRDLVVGVALGAVTLKVLDLGAFTVLDRPFNRSATGARRARVRERRARPVGSRPGERGRGGRPRGAVVFLPWAVRRLLGSRAHRRQSLRAVALAVVWVRARCSASRSPARRCGWRAAERGRRRGSGGAPPTGTRRSSPGRWRRTLRRPGASADLSLLEGKDVVVAFVESYGRVAVQGPGSGPVRTLLDDGGRPPAGPRLHVGQRLARLADVRRQQARLAHSTLQSGLTVSDQARYGRLLTSSRTTLTSGVRAGRLAHGGGAAVDPRDLARGAGVLPVRPGSTAGRRSAMPARGSGSPPCPTSTPSRPCSARARETRPPSPLRGGRPGVEPRAVDPHAAD